MEQRQDDTLPFRRTQPFESADSPESAEPAEVESDGAERPRLDLLEERLVARKREQQIGEVVIRKEVEEVPGRLDVETFHDEVEVEHIPVGRVVNEREEPRHEGDDLVVPVYEEQVVMVKRLVLKEYVRVRRTRATEHQVYTDTLRRDRLVVEDQQKTGLVHEVYRGPDGENLADPKHSATEGVMEWLRKALFP
jgi:uncharacterized protein (TIGR02271 family)